MKPRKRNKQKPSDREIMERLNALVGFVPWDKWDLVIGRLRAGKTYLVWHRDEHRTLCVFIDGCTITEEKE